jgi:hypothetical protein
MGDPKTDSDRLRRISPLFHADKIKVPLLMIHGEKDANPGTGGELGSGDGFLRITSPNGIQHNLGSVSTGAEYAGNWTAAGVTQVRFFLNDVGAANPLEIHFSIGNDVNFWQYNAGLVPPLHSWALFVVDLTSSAAFTHIIDAPAGQTYASALAGVDRILVRHDKSPFVMTPDPLTAIVDQLAAHGRALGQRMRLREWPALRHSSHLLFSC